MKLAWVCLLAVGASAGLQLPTCAVAQSSQIAALTLRVPAAIIETSRRECRMMASQHVSGGVLARETDEIRAALDNYCMETARDAIRDLAEGVQIHKYSSIQIASCLQQASSGLQEFDGLSVAARLAACARVRSD